MKIKKVFSSVLATACAIVSVGVISTSAATYASGSKYLGSTYGTVYGSITTSSYPPSGTRITATSSISGSANSSLRIITGLDVLNYPSGTAFQSDVVNGTQGSKAAVSATGGAPVTLYKSFRCYSSHEVRGTNPGVLYLTSSVMTI